MNYRMNEWESFTAIFPRMSITNKVIVGKMLRRQWHGSRRYSGHIPKIHSEYVKSEKELFEAKLKGITK